MSKEQIEQDGLVCVECHFAIRNNEIGFTDKSGKVYHSQCFALGYDLTGLTENIHSFLELVITAFKRFRYEYEKQDMVAFNAVWMSELDKDVAALAHQVQLIRNEAAKAADLEEASRPHPIVNRHQVN